MAMKKNQNLTVMLIKNPIITQRLTSAWVKCTQNVSRDNHMWIPPTHIIQYIMLINQI